MSRSVKHTPMFSYIRVRSEATDKKIWHGRLRAHERTVLASGGEDMPHVKEVSNPWTMAKDGKGRWATGEDNPSRSKSMRK
jgi:hypothetical protein